MGRSGEDRIATVPNALSLLRLSCVPVFLWLLFGRDPPNRYAAAGLLGVLGATDFVDGYVARRFHQVSTVGKVLDPVADRVLLLVGVGGILVAGAAPAWLGALVLFRELVVALAVLALAAAGAPRIDVRLAGKAQTFLLMVAFPLFLTSTSTAGWAELARTLAWCAAVPGVVLSYYSAIAYVAPARRALAERRVGSGA